MNDSRIYYLKGSWNIHCQRCNAKRKFTEVKKEWTGLHVCSTCFETRNPQDLLKSFADPMGVSVANKQRPTLTNVTPPFDPSTGNP